MHCVINFLFICLDNPDIRPHKPDLDPDTCGLKFSLTVSTLFLSSLSLTFLAKGMGRPELDTEMTIVVIVVSFIMLLITHVICVWHVTDPRNKLDRVLRIYVTASFIGLCLLIVPVITLITVFVILTYTAIQSNSERIGKLINGTQDKGISGIISYFERRQKNKEYSAKRQEELMKEVNKYESKVRTNSLCYLELHRDIKEVAEVLIRLLLSDKYNPSAPSTLKVALIKLEKTVLDNFPREEAKYLILQRAAILDYRSLCINIASQIFSKKNITIDKIRDIVINYFNLIAEQVVSEQEITIPKELSEILIN